MANCLRKLSEKKKKILFFLGKLGFTPGAGSGFVCPDLALPVELETRRAIVLLLK